jgi:peptide deformylase
MAAAPDAMAQLTILRYPDPRLHTVAKPVAAVDERIRQLVDDMLETMYAAQGVGLAATQVDVHERLIVMDTSDNARPAAGADQPRDHLAQRRDAGGRGRLPVGADHLRQGRAPCQREGAGAGARRQAFEIQADDLAAICVQHEMDHLLGKVFVEYLSLLKRDRIRTKMIKKTRDEQRDA